MTENPYQPAQLPTVATRSTRWLVWLGILLSAIAVGCIAISIVGVMMTFQATAESSDKSAADMVDSIRLATMPIFVGAPLGVIGITLFIVGLVIRQPVEPK